MPTKKVNKINGKRDPLGVVFQHKAGRGRSNNVDGGGVSAHEFEWKRGALDAGSVAKFRLLLWGPQ